MKISVVLPCHVKDLDDLKLILPSWVNQTISPHEIIVYLKPVEPNYNHGLYDIDLKGIDLKVITNDKLTTRGFSKNESIKESTGDIICVSDCDDSQHPEKLKYVTHVFNNNPDCDIFLHSYSTYDETNFTEPFDENYELMDCNHCNDYGIGGIGKWNSVYHFHNSHISFRKKIFELHKFDESSSVCGSDDSVFNNDGCMKNFKTFCTNKKLTSFRP
jgi:glycosyltransferase involved in cell wall biosynthesis